MAKAVRTIQVIYWALFDKSTSINAVIWLLASFLKSKKKKKINKKIKKKKKKKKRRRTYFKLDLHSKPDIPQ